MKYEGKDGTAGWREGRIHCGKKGKKKLYLELQFSNNGFYLNDFNLFLYVLSLLLYSIIIFW